MPDNENIFPVNKVVQWLTAPSNQVEKINSLKETKLIKNNGIQCFIIDITGAGLNIRFKVKSPSETAILALSHIMNNKFWKSWEVSGSAAKLIKDYLEQYEPLDFQKLNYESVPLDKVVDWVCIEVRDWSKLIGGYIENHDTEFYKVISFTNDVSKIILRNKSDNSEKKVVLTDLLNNKIWIKGYFSSKIIIEILNQIPDPVEQKNYLKLKNKYHVQGVLFSRLSKNDTTPVRKLFNVLKLIDENKKYIPSNAEIDSFEDNKLQGLLAEIYFRLFNTRKDVGKLAKASSYFRLINLSKKSVEITEEFSKKPFGKYTLIAMVLTSRSAALKDCKKHSAAEQELKRAIGYQRGVPTEYQWNVQHALNHYEK